MKIEISKTRVMGSYPGAEATPCLACASSCHRLIPLITEKKTTCTLNYYTEQNTKGERREDEGGGVRAESWDSGIPTSR